MIITNHYLKMRSSYKLINKYLNEYFGEKKSEQPSTFAVIRNNLIIFAIYAYFTGWIYIYFYNKNLGISFQAINIDFYYMFVYSFQVIKSNIWIVLFYFVVILLLLAIFSRWKKFVNYFFKPIILIFTFFALYFLAIAEAKEVSLSTRRGKNTQTVCFNFKQEFVDKNKNFPIFKELLIDCVITRLKYITESKDYYYVLYQPYKNPKKIPLGSVFSIPKDQVLLIVKNIE